MDPPQYPQPGRSLSPRLLADYLEVVTPDWAQRAWHGPGACPRTLADLQQSAWTGFSRDQCERLADLVPSTLKRVLMDRPDLGALSRFLAPVGLPTTLRPEQLNISVRATHRLWIAGCRSDLRPLQQITVG